MYEKQQLLDNSITIALASIILRLENIHTRLRSPFGLGHDKII